MPQRTRSHQIEDFSRIEFKRLVTRLNWVVRKLDDYDYGVDDGVEIFNGSSATGLTFLVQAKSTDEPKLKKALNVPLKPQHWNYFRALTDPVLIVRYHVPTEKMYAKWSHTAKHDKTWRAAIKLEETDELTVENVGALANEASRYKAFRSSYFAWPIEVRLDAGKTSEDRLRTGIADVLQAFPGRVKIVRGDTQPERRLEVTLSDDAIVTHAGLSSYTIDARVADYSVEEIAPAVVLAIGTVLDQLGYGAEAADMYEAALIARGFPADTVDAVGRSMGRCGRLDAALRVARQWSSKPELEWWAAAVAILDGCRSEGGLHLLPFAEDASVILNEIASKCSDAQVQVTSYANLVAGRIWFNIGEWEKANAQFVRFGMPGADEQALLRNFATAAFEAKDFARAVDLYSGAINQEPQDLELVARRADALLHAGQLLEAKGAFDDYLARVESPSPAWEFKRLAAAFLIDSGLKSGERDSSAAAALWNGSKLAAQPDRYEFLFRVHSLDYLHSEAWAEIGALTRSEQQWDRAFGPFLVAAISSQSPASWAEVFVGAFRRDDERMQLMAVGHGAAKFDSRFHSALEDVTDGESDQTDLQEKAAGIDDQFNHYRYGDATASEGSDTLT